MVVLSCKNRIILVMLCFLATHGVDSELDQRDYGHEENEIVSGNECQNIGVSERFDCFPEAWASQKLCEMRNCCWKPIVETMNSSLYNSAPPFCFFPKNSYSYEIIKTSPYKVVIQLTNNTWRKSMFRQLEVSTEYYSTKILRIKIKPKSSRPRYEVPITLNIPTKVHGPNEFKLKITESLFGIEVIRQSSGFSVFNTYISTAPLIFTDQLLQISTKLSTSMITGLGEHRTNYSVMMDRWQKWLFWAQDQAPIKDSNLYGTHPVYLGYEGDGKAHIVLMMNSNAMEVIGQPMPALTYRSIGGILDFVFILGDNAVDATQQYIRLIGKPFLPPYWSLGFHLCRFGYNSADDVKKVIDRNRALGIPYDTQWVDIDYMSKKRDWTYDSAEHYKELPRVLDDLHKHHQRFIMIVDPCISDKRDNYSVYRSLLESKAFVRNATGEPLQAVVWPGTCIFPDFFHPNITEWWYNSAKDFRQEIPFDGMWIDMNEPSNFVHGSTSGCTGGSLDKPPYDPIGDLAKKTICPSAKHHLSSHYNLHSLYGHSESEITYWTLRKLLQPERSLIVSRSTFLASGRWTAHWTGDNEASWHDMAMSIPTILKFQLFGIPMVGADICGFRENTTEELCVRWTQLGSFYPFMRNHADRGSKEQDPAVFSKKAQQIMKSAIELRYRLLPNLYTSMVNCHMNGIPPLRHMRHQYPLDPVTFNLDTQFLWESYIMVAPVLLPQTTMLNIYFPADRWFDIETGQMIAGYKNWSVLPAPMEKLNVFVRGGSILTLLPAAITTYESRLHPFSLLVALDFENMAEGKLLWDDGVSQDSISSNKYALIKFRAANGTLLINAQFVGYKAPMPVSSIVIYGIIHKVQYVLLNDSLIGFVYENGILYVSDINIDIKELNFLRWN